MHAYIFVAIEKAENLQMYFLGRFPKIAFFVRTFPKKQMKRDRVTGEPLTGAEFTLHPATGDDEVLDHLPGDTPLVYGIPGGAPARRAAPRVHKDWTLFINGDGHVEVEDGVIRRLRDDCHFVRLETRPDKRQISVRLARGKPARAKKRSCMVVGAIGCEGTTVTQIGFSIPKEDTRVEDLYEYSIKGKRIRQLSVGDNTCSVAVIGALTGWDDDEGEQLGLLIQEGAGVSFCRWDSPMKRSFLADVDGELNLTGVMLFHKYVHIIARKDTNVLGKSFIDVILDMRGNSVVNLGLVSGQISGTCNPKTTLHATLTSSAPEALLNKEPGSPMSGVIILERLLDGTEREEPGNSAEISVDLRRAMFMDGMSALLEDANTLKVNPMVYAALEQAVETARADKAAGKLFE